MISKRWVIQRRLPTTHPTIIQISLKLSSSFGWVVDGVDVVIVLKVVLLPVVVAAAGNNDVIVGDGVDIDVVGNAAVSISANFI